MRLKSVTLNKFRIFSSLIVKGVPEEARLIILVGPNGCGKSCFFDALHSWHTLIADKEPSWEVDYHNKAGSPQRDAWPPDAINPEFHGPLPENKKKAIYVRSAYRNDPEFRLKQLKRVGDPLNEKRVSRMIDNDAAVAHNFQRLAGKGLQDLYADGDGATTFARYREESIGGIRKAMRRVFPDLELDSLGNPLEDGTFHFTKGTSKGFLFKNLSGGEKAVFDLILDFVIAGRAYDDTIFCIDEPEAHMNTRLQAELLSVLYGLIPENCQLILATHSIGMMRRARDIEAEHPGSVVFLDFEHDFDETQVIEPTKPDRTFWKRAYEVSFDDMAALVAPDRVVICEGHPKLKNPVKNHSHDARCYESIFESEFPETRFVSMGNDSEIEGDKRGLAEALGLLFADLKILRLIDRDYRSEDDITDAAKNGIRVLSRRNLESYLFDDEVLRPLAAGAGAEDKIDELLAEKTRILTERTGDPKDDLKPASGQLYVACTKILDLTQHGNKAKLFMRSTLAPLIKPGMAVYDELKRDIFAAPVRAENT